MWLNVGDEICALSPPVGPNGAIPSTPASIILVDRQLDIVTPALHHAHVLDCIFGQLRARSGSRKLGGGPAKAVLPSNPNQVQPYNCIILREWHTKAVCLLVTQTLVTGPDAGSHPGMHVSDPRGRHVAGEFRAVYLLSWYWIVLRSHAYVDEFRDASRPRLCMPSGAGASGWQPFEEAQRPC